MSISDLTYLIFGMGERNDLPPLTDQKLDRLLDADDDAGRALLYKHSPRCIVCRRAIGRVESFAADHAQLAVYRIDVLEQRALSDRVARELDVRHESPQAILLHDGRPAWWASHGDITEEALNEAAGR